jgi:hypothetical protein
MKRYLAAAFGLVVMPVSLAHAQACLGLTSLSARPMNLTASAEFTEGAKSFSGRFGFGSSIAFGGITGQIVDYDDVDGTGKGIGADGGLTFLTGAQQNVAVCPVASLSYFQNPDYEIGNVSFGSNATSGSAGIALGATLNAGATMKLIPFGVLQGVYSRLSVDTDLGSDSDTDTYGMLTGGLSFVINDGFLIRPIINVPLGLDDSDPTYGIGISFAFGNR